MNVRLHITDKCARSCKGCCMKQSQFDLEDVPPISHMRYLPEGTEMVLLTGGEPMLAPERVIHITDQIKECSPGTKVVVYTAGPTGQLSGAEWRYWDEVARMVDGFTYTLHEREDIGPFAMLLNDGTVFDPARLSLRLNIFESVEPDNLPMMLHRDILHWDIRWGYTWVADCPLPENEVFMRWVG